MPSPWGPLQRSHRIALVLSGLLIFVCGPPHISSATEVAPDLSGSSGLRDAAAHRLVVVFEEGCDQVDTAARLLSTYMHTQSRQGALRDPSLKYLEAAEFSVEGPVDRGAYTQTTFALKLGNFEEQEVEAAAQEQQVRRCRIAHSDFKRVGVSVLSLEECLLVEAPALQRAFQGDACVRTIEPDSLVHIEAPPEPELQPQNAALPPAVPSPQGLYWRELIGLGEPKTVDCKREVVVAVIDSGVAWDHPALVQNMWVNPGETPGNGVDDDGNGYVDDVHGFNFLDKIPDPSDDVGHGTHVAGIIGARSLLGPGVRGVCRDTSIAALRFMDKYGVGSTSNAIEALNYAVSMGFKVSCNSWGGSGYSEALRRAIARSHEDNHLFIAAAGNRARHADLLPEFPAAFGLSNIITVAASDSNDRLAGFSNYGLLSVHLTAPGVDILSTFPPDTNKFMSGTSMAAPMVAAVAAMLMSVQDRPLQDVRRAIFNSVTRSNNLLYLVMTGGRVNATAALEYYLNDAAASEEQQKQLVVEGGQQQQQQSETDGKQQPGAEGTKLQTEETAPAEPAPAAIVRHCRG